LVHIVIRVVCRQEEEQIAGCCCLSDLYRMPKTRGQLAIVSFFLVCTFLNVDLYHFGCLPVIYIGTKDPTERTIYSGANWVGILLLYYNGFAALVAFLLPVLQKLTTDEFPLVSLIAERPGVISNLTTRTSSILQMLRHLDLLASILAMPYAILTVDRFRQTKWEPIWVFF